MTLDEATKQADERASLTGIRWYVLGPCPTDGYWTAGYGARHTFWADLPTLHEANPILADAL